MIDFRDDTQVILTMREWNILKNEAHGKGRIEGHLSALRFLKIMVNNPHGEARFGDGFPEDLKQAIETVVEKFRSITPDPRKN